VLKRRVYLVGWSHLVIIVLIEVLHIHMVAVVNVQIYVRSWLVLMLRWRPSVLHILLINWVSVLIVLI
jgi:hypothetical protein